MSVRPQNVNVNLKEKIKHARSKKKPRWTSLKMGKIVYQRHLVIKATKPFALSWPQRLNQPDPVSEPQRLKMPEIQVHYNIAHQ